jgi:hypothetical protein
MNKKSNDGSIIGWIFGVLFFAIGVLNLFLVHPVPGIFYILLSLIYFPPVTPFIRKKFGLSIPVALKIILGLVILWATLAVGDLMEMFESWHLGQ